jgi:hypothetical protein
LSLENPLNETAYQCCPFLKKQKKLVVGTSSRGVYVLILIRILINIDRNNVLMNNSILSIGLEKKMICG